MRILMFGSLPPKIGGVSTSVKNTMIALKTKNIDTSIILNFSSIKALFHRYDIAHVHYVKSWKIFLALILGKIFAKKNIFTLHDSKFLDDYTKTSFFKLYRINVKLMDGIIFLNQSAQNRYRHISPPSIVLGSMFVEGVLSQQINKKNYIKREKNKIYLLLYAFGKIIRNNKSVYGAEFILENLSFLDDQYVLVFVDIQGDYKNECNEISSNKLIYIDHQIDFLSLLLEVDIYIRPTTTDGSSVAVQEALMLGKKVLASDVVERPAEVTLYRSGDFEDFKEKLENLKETEGFTPNSIDDYLAFCNQLLEKKK